MSRGSQDGLNTFDKLLHSIPSGVDPFALIISFQTSSFHSRPFRITIVLLILLDVCHFLTSCFCVTILLLPSIRGAKRSQWFLKRLYIEDSQGTYVYKHPLFLINTGAFMAISQLLGSICAQFYLGVRIKGALSFTPAPPYWSILPLGMMVLFEYFAYWSLAHCLLVTLYFGHQLPENDSKRLMRWRSMPNFINFSFFGIPLGAAIVAGTLLGRNVKSFKNYFDLRKSLFATLDRGSLVWQKLQLASASEERAQLSASLSECISETKKAFRNSELGNKALVNHTRCFQVVLLTLMSASLLIFGFLFWKLRFHHRYAKSSARYTSHRTSGLPGWSNIHREKKAIRSSIAHQIHLASMRTHTQLFNLTLRAVGVSAAIMTNMIGSLVVIVKAKELLTNDYWCQVTSWIVVIGGVWSAVPVLYQSWRLYSDPRGDAFETSTNPKHASSEVADSVKGPSSVSDSVTMEG